MVTDRRKPRDLENPYEEKETSKCIRMRRVPGAKHISLVLVTRREMRDRIDRFRLSGGASLSLSSIFFSPLLSALSNACQNLPCATLKKLLIKIDF